MNKNCDTEDMNTSTTSKWDNKTSFALWNKDTQAEIIMAEEKILIWFPLGNNQQ